MQKFAKILDAVLKPALVLLMVALVSSVSWQVISRYIFSSPSSWTEEVARFLLIWIGVLGAAFLWRADNLGKLTGFYGAGTEHFEGSRLATLGAMLMLIAVFQTVRRRAAGASA